MFDGEAKSKGLHDLAQPEDIVEVGRNFPEVTDHLVHDLLLRGEFVVLEDRRVDSGGQVGIGGKAPRRSRLEIGLDAKLGNEPMGSGIMGEGLLAVAEPPVVGIWRMIAAAATLVRLPRREQPHLIADELVEEFVVARESLISLFPLQIAIEG